MVKIRTQLAPVRSGVNSFGYGNPARYVTVHQTGNTNRGANAAMHANLQSGVYGASWHWTVDDHEAVQSFPHSVKCWHASDGVGAGNTQSVAVEICINSDGNYVQAVKNGAELVAYILKKENLSIDKVRQHYDWDKIYRKNCPAQIRAGKAGITWSKFLGMVKQAMKGQSVSVPKAKTSGKSDSQLADEVIAGKHGTGEARKQSLGSRYSAVQALVNQKLSGKPKLKSEASIVQEVIDGKHGVGQARFNKLQRMGYNPSRVQSLVNQKLLGSQPKRSVRKLYLPANAVSWRVYHPNGPYTVGNEVGFLAPSRFGGLAYPVRGNPVTGVYLIDTRDFGRVAIYAGAGTSAQVR